MGRPDRADLDGVRLMLLSRDQILGADDLPRRSVSVPEWGGEVIVRTLSGRERDEWEVAVSKRSGGTPQNIRAAWAAATICDDAGQPLFTVEDVEALGRKSGAALARVFDVAAQLNHLTDSDVEDLEKNSGAGPAGVSGSD